MLLVGFRCTLHFVSKFWNSDYFKGENVLRIIIDGRNESIHWIHNFPRGHNEEVGRQREHCSKVGECASCFLQREKIFKTCLVDCARGMLAKCCYILYVFTKIF